MSANLLYFETSETSTVVKLRLFPSDKYLETLGLSNLSKLRGDSTRYERIRHEFYDSDEFIKGKENRYVRSVTYLDSSKPKLLSEQIAVHNSYNILCYKEKKISSVDSTLKVFFSFEFERFYSSGAEDFFLDVVAAPIPYTVLTLQQKFPETIEAITVNFADRALNYFFSALKLGIALAFEQYIRSFPAEFLPTPTKFMYLMKALHEDVYEKIFESYDASKKSVCERKASIVGNAELQATNAVAKEYAWRIFIGPSICQQGKCMNAEEKEICEAMIRSRDTFMRHPNFWVSDHDDNFF